MSEQLMHTPGGLSEYVNEIFLLYWSLILVKSKTLVLGLLSLSARF